MSFYCSILLSVISLTIVNSSNAQSIGYFEKTVTIKNQGWELRGDLLLVKTKTNAPVVLMLNKANGNRKPYQMLAKLLAARNISSLRLDLRAEGESINKGKFIPFDSVNNKKIDLEETYTDIIAAEKYLLGIRSLDSQKFAIVGASYSGEEMMIASRKFRAAECYIALSPGSFSNESIMKIDSSKANILFLKSMDEKSMQGFEKIVFSATKRAQVLIVPGAMHATDILDSYPDISLFLADWLHSHLKGY